MSVKITKNKSKEGVLNSVTESLYSGTKISWEMGRWLEKKGVTPPAPNFFSILIFIMTTSTLLSASVTYFKHISYFNLLLPILTFLPFLLQVLV
jgi:hypothetical protein